MAFISSEKGSTAWKHQRLTAVILILSLLFFTRTLFTSHMATTADLIHWMRTPFVGALFILTLSALFYHSFLGLKMIMEDYIHPKQFRQAILFVLFILHVFFTILGSLLVILM